MAYKQSKLENSHGWPYEVLVVRGFIKGQAAGELTSCEDYFHCLV